MSVYSIGDQARAFAMRTAVGGMKKTLDTLVHEQASGQVSDIGTRVAGNTQPLRSIETRIADLEGFRKVTDEVEFELSLMIDALAFVQEIAASRAVLLINEPFGESESLITERSRQAAMDFEAIVSKLNANIGGRYLFSGTDIHAPALVPAREILTQVDSLIAGMTNAADVAAAIGDWFDDPEDGFIKHAYRSQSTEMRRVTIDHGEMVDIPTTAASENMRDTLKGLAIAAMVSRGALDNDPFQQRELLRRGGAIAYDNDTKMVAEQSGLGHRSYVVGQAISENSAAHATLTRSMNDIRRADPFETSIALEDLVTRISIIYSLTDRLSRLKLVDYLR